MFSTNYRNKGRQNGVSMIETLIVTPILMLFGLAFIHLALVFQAQSNLEYAALMAARVGASSSIDIGLMQTEIIRRMNASDNTKGTGVAPVVNITVLNPSIAMFNSCGQRPTYSQVGCFNAGRCEIPYFGLQFRSNAAVCDGASIQDANILRISVDYDYDSHIPFVSRLSFVGRGSANAPGGSDAVTLNAVATVRMQSAPRLTVANQPFMAAN